MNNVSFVPYRPFDKGRYPSIAVNSHGVTIEGHQRQGDSKIYYNVGTAANQAISFKQDSGTKFDEGAPPRFAINDNNWAVEIHKSNGPSSKLWYHVGLVNAGNQTWDYGSSHDDGSGHDPDIALNNSNTVVNVYEDGGDIKIRSGQVDTGKKTIKFNSSSKIASGAVPTVAMNNNGIVVAAFVVNNGIQFWLGQVNGNNVDKKGSGMVTGGQNPSVGLTDDGFVILGFDNGNAIYSLAGQVSGNSIVWGMQQQYAEGTNPWVDANGSIGVQAFPTGEFYSYALLAGSGRIYDRKTWMGDSATFQARTLNQLSFPGSHDAGMSITQNCTSSGRTCNTRTQFISIGQQLDMGARYYDLRPVYYKGTYYTGHYGDTGVPLVGIQGCNGQSLPEVLDQVAAFLRTTSHEVPILKFSHYYDKDKDKFGFDSTQMQGLINLVLQKLPGLLFINTTSSRLADLPLSQITSSGSRAIAVFEDLGSLGNAALGIYSYADYKPGQPLTADLVVYDRYSNTNSLSTMETDQWSKQANAANHGGDLFLLSWTLTQSGPQATSCGTPGVETIISLAEQAAAALYGQVNAKLNGGAITPSTLTNVLYLDICNGFGTDVAIMVNDKF